MKQRLCILLIAVLSVLMLASCNSKLDQAFEWTEEKTEELGDEIRGN